MSHPLLHVSLDAGYGSHQILKGLNLDIAAGEALGMVGTSGTGKSTLILALMGLLPWRGGWIKGEVLFEGRNLIGMKEKEARRLRGNRIALIPQSPLSALNSSLRLSTHFEEAWKAHNGGSAADLQKRLNALLEQVNLPSDRAFLSRKPGQISVGQAQRIVIALALLHRPALVIADEPTSALDSQNQVDVLKLLSDANRNQETALLFVSHDLLSVLQLCERLAVLQGGSVMETLPIHDIERHARHPATLALLESLPIPAHAIAQYKLQQAGRRENSAPVAQAQGSTHGAARATPYTHQEIPELCPAIQG